VQVLNDPSNLTRWATDIDQRARDQQFDEVFEGVQPDGIALTELPLMLGPTSPRASHARNRRTEKPANSAAWRSLTANWSSTTSTTASLPFPMSPSSRNRGARARRLCTTMPQRVSADERWTGRV
jgi:hypothetical protein